MGVEVTGFEVAESPVERVETVENISFSHENENGKLSPKQAINAPIKFGSHGDEPVIVEEAITKVSESDLRKKAVSEWPAPKQIHSFYFVKYRSYEDPNLKAKLDLADKEIQKQNEARVQITEGLKSKRNDRSQIISQLKVLTSEDKQFRGIIDGKRKEMEPLNTALGKLRNTNGARWERGGAICSSEEELDDIIRSMHYRMQHESIPLTEEKKLLKEIKQLEQTRDKVIANVAIKTKIQDSFGQKESIQDQVKLIGGDLDGIRKEHLILRGKIKLLEEELKVIDNDLNNLQEKLKTVGDQRDRAFENLQKLRKLRDEGNANFYKNRTLLNNARDLASKRDVKALEELSHAEVGKYMSLWNSTNSFREDYEKRILGSLDFRLLSRDGRMRNPDEKPIVVVEAPALPVQTATAQKSNAKQQPKEAPKEEVIKPLQPESLSTSNKIKEEAKKVPKESPIVTSEEKVGDLTVPEEVSPVKEAIDEVKEKEMKKLEEKEKAQQALDRKKKKAEKSAKIAAIRAQNEALKKLKDLEKKEKKKNAASSPDLNPDESAEAVSEVAELESDMPMEALVRSKKKEQKENNALRNRTRSKGVKTVPKAMIKRKKGINYWLWVTPVVVVALILGVIGYHFAN